MLKINKALIGGSLILLITFNLYHAFNYFFHFAMARMLTIADYGVLVALYSIIYIFTIFSESVQTIITKYASKFAVVLALLVPVMVSVLLVPPDASAPPKAPLSAFEVSMSLVIKSSKVVPDIRSACKAAMLAYVPAEAVFSAVSKLLPAARLPINVWMPAPPI